MFSATYTSLSTVTKRCLKTKTTNLHRTPPLHKHFVGGSNFYTYLSKDGISRNFVVVTGSDCLFKSTISDVSMNSFPSFNFNFM